MSGDAGQEPLETAQRLHAGIGCSSDTASARHAKGTHEALPQGQLADLFKKGDVLFVRQRIATFDKVHSHLGQALADVQFILQ